MTGGNMLVGHDDDEGEDDDLQVPRALPQDGDKHRQQLSLDDSDEMLIMID